MNRAGKDRPQADHYGAVVNPIFDRIAWEMDMHVSALDAVHQLFSRHKYRFDAWPCEWR